MFGLEVDKDKIGTSPLTWRFVTFFDIRRKHTVTSRYLDNPSLNYTATDQISGPDSDNTSDDAINLVVLAASRCPGPGLAGEYLQIPIFEYRSIYRLVPRSVQCCQLPCYHGRDPLPTCMVLASNQVVRTRALVHAQTWFPMGEVPSALCWSSGMPPPAAGGGGRF